MPSLSKLCPGRRLFHGVWIVGIISTLFGCSPERYRGGAARYRTNHDEGFLVVARHERQREIITETSREVVGCEVKRSGPGGEFTLSPPASRRGAHPVTYLIISKPGFRLYQDQHGPDGELQQIDLEPTTNYRDEYLAAIGFDRAIYGFTPALDQNQKRLVEEHSAARHAFVKSRYPAESAAAEKRRALRTFKRRAGAGRIVAAAAALADGGVAMLSPTDGGRDLLIVDSGDQLLGQLALSDPRSTALARDDNGLALVDAGAVRRFDFGGKALASIALDPAPEDIDAVTGLALVDAGFLLGLEASLSMSGVRKPCRLRLYSCAGKLVKERELPSVLNIDRLFAAPDGAVLVEGKLLGDFLYGVEVAGMKKQDGTPRGIIRLADWSAEPEVIITGVDSAVVFAGGLLAYAGDLYPAADHELVGAGVAGLLHQVLLQLTWRGEVVATHDVSDAGVDVLAFGEPLGTRLLFFSGSDLFELEFDQLRQSP